ncbi:TetR family transcriptional regulator [Roseibium sp. SCP14]|uniref:TetR family transcriptional regulator n=1 Tax=Roseibium sp. SCP14 TaxID=3141375 RepID=UPI003338A423
MTEKFLRARSTEQKDVRRQQILEAAQNVIRREGIEALTLAGIAAETGITKSAFYRYFKSKEEILAYILISEAHRITDQLGAKVHSCNSLRQFAAVFAETCARQTLFCTLAADLARILERNIALDRLTDIKREFAKILREWTDLLLDASVTTDRVTAIEFVRSAYVTLSGLWPMTQERPVVQQAIRQAGLDGGFSDFEREYTRLLKIIANGLVCDQAASRV